MFNISLTDIHRSYIDCLNRQDWPELGRDVNADVLHNGRAFELSGYRAMLARDFTDIPDLHFQIELSVSEVPQVAARLAFHCSPKAEFPGLDIGGRTISFAGNVFYEIQDSKIVSVWSIVDKDAIEEQLRR